MDDNREYYLLIDTSTEVCTIALGDGLGNVVAERRNNMQNKHAEALAPMAAELLSMLPEDGRLEGVGLAEGPGSYTGLRIGAAYVKGLCWTRSIPLVTISTPELLTRTYIARCGASSADLYMPMIDARRMEVYTGIYTKDCEVVRGIHALILTEEETMQALADEVSGQRIVYFGSGAEKAQEVMARSFGQAVYGGDMTPEVSCMLQAVIGKIDAGEHKDIAYWEPFYLKEYEAKKSTNKVLREIVGE